MRYFIHARLLILLGLLCGCENKSPPPHISQNTAKEAAAIAPAVGIVDYQRLSRTLGINTQMMEKREKLQAEFNRVANDSRLEIVKKLKEMGNDLDSLNEEDRKSLQVMDIARRKKLEKLESENNRAMQETSRWLQRVFRQKVKGPIEQIAKSKKLNLVLVQSPGDVAYAIPGVDITDMVIQKMGDEVIRENSADTTEETP